MANLGSILVQNAFTCNCIELSNSVVFVGSLPVNILLVLNFLPMACVLLLVTLSYFFCCAKY